MVVDVVLPEIQANAKVQILVSTDEQYDWHGYWPMLQVPSGYERKQRRIHKGDKHVE